MRIPSCDQCDRRAMKVCNRCCSAVCVDHCHFSKGFSYCSYCHEYVSTVTDWAIRDITNFDTSGVGTRPNLGALSENAIALIAYFANKSPAEIAALNC